MQPDAHAQPRRRGRRPAGDDTRGAILAAAREEFATRGYDGATFRGIARAAGVDPRLVHHYFTGKEEVFASAMELPVQPAQLVARVVGPGVDGIGERLVRSFFGAWDGPEGRPVITALLRTAVGDGPSTTMLRQFLTDAVVRPLTRALPGDDPELRATLAVSQMVGVAMMRYVLHMEPVASATVDDLVPMLAPVVQTHLTGPTPPLHRTAPRE